MKNIYVYFTLLTPLLSFATTTTGLVKDKNINQAQAVDDKNKQIEEKLKKLTSENAAIEDQIYEITFNKEWNFVGILRTSNDKILISTQYLPPELLEKIVPNAFTKKDGENYLSLNSEYITYQDNENFLVNITAPIDLFKNQELEFEFKKNVFANTINAFYGSYEIGLSNEGLRNTRATFDTTYVSKNDWVMKNDFFLNRNEITRLSTTWKKYNKDKSTWWAGDISGEVLSGNNSLNLLGIRYTTPYFSSSQFLNDALPQLPISGYAINPSKLELYLNNQLIQQSDLSTGKYNINIPVQATGVGSVKAYVYDLVGKPVEINIPFYNHNDILKKGHYEYDVSAGFIRKDNTSKSFSYGVPVMQGLIKYGISNNLTQDLFVQSSRVYSSASSLTHWIPNAHLGKMSLGLSVNSKKQYLVRTGFDRVSTDWSTGIELQNSPNYCGGYNQESCLKKQSQAYISAKLPYKFGGISGSYAHRTSTKDKNTVISLQWSSQLSKYLSIFANLSKTKYIGDFNQSNKTRFHVGLNYSLQSNLHSYTNLEKNNYQQGFSLSETQEYEKFGSGSITFNNREGENSSNLYYKNKSDLFDYQFNYFKDKSSSSVNLNLRGGLAYIPDDNYLTLMKPSTSGIIYVKVDAATEPMEIFHQNKFYGMTDKSGKIIVANATPYNRENIEINLVKLSNDVTLESADKSSYIPPTGAVLVNFKAKPMPYLVTIKNVKSGTLFNIGSEDFVVGEYGETSLDRSGKAEIYNNNGKKCTLDLNPNQREYLCE